MYPGEGMEEVVKFVEQTKVRNKKEIRVMASKPGAPDWGH